MNEETKKFIHNAKCNELCEQLSKKINRVRTEIREENLIAIGAIVVNFQSLENNIRFFIGILADVAGDRPVMDTFTIKVSYSNLITMLQTLAIEKKFHWHNELQILLNQARKAEEIRNQIMHSIWTGPRSKKKFCDKRGVVETFEHYEPNELNLVAQAIYNIDVAIQALYFDWIIYRTQQGDQPKWITTIEV